MRARVVCVLMSSPPEMNDCSAVGVHDAWKFERSRALLWEDCCSPCGRTEAVERVPRNVLETKVREIQARSLSKSTLSRETKHALTAADSL